MFLEYFQVDKNENKKIFLTFFVYKYVKKKNKDSCNTCDTNITLKLV